MIVYGLTCGNNAVIKQGYFVKFVYTSMELFLDIAQLTTGVLLMLAILLQSGRSGGLGSAFGGGDSVAVTRRGAEKGLFNTTVVLAVVFVGLAVARMFL